MTVIQARRPDPDEPTDGFAVALEARPELWEKLVYTMTAEAAKAEGERLRQQGLRIFTKHLPQVLIGKHGEASIARMPPHEVIGAYLTAANRAAAELAAIGLQIRIGGRALRKYNLYD